MIARLQGNADPEFVANLNDQGVWESPNPLIAEHLNAFYPPGGMAFDGLSFLPFGYAAAGAAAEEFDCTVTHDNPPEPIPPDAVS